MNSRAHAMVEFALPLPSHTCAQLPENKYHSKAQLGDVHVCQQPIWFGAGNEKKYDFESKTQIISILSENSSTALTKIVFNPQMQRLEPRRKYTLLDKGLARSKPYASSCHEGTKILSK